MLRISPMGCEDGSVRLRLEGRLVASWVELLSETCQAHQAKVGSLLSIDLSAVGYASREGIDLLHHLQGQGVRCVGWPPFLKMLFQGRFSTLWE